MLRRTLAVGLALSCSTLSSAADELKAATKGKIDAVQTYFGDLQSFDGATLTFAVPLPSAVGNGTAAITQQFQPIQTMAKTFKPSETELEILLTVGVPQDPINGGDFAASTQDRHTKDVDLQRKQYQAAQADHDRAQQQAQQNNQVEQRDLRKCSNAGADQVIEKDPDNEGKEKLPVNGKIISIKNGYVTLLRAADGQQKQYRLEDLSRIILGSCSVSPH